VINEDQPNGQCERDDSFVLPKTVIGEPDAGCAERALARPLKAGGVA